MTTPTITAPAGLNATLSNVVLVVTLTVVNGAVTMAPAFDYKVVSQTIGGATMLGVTRLD